MIDINITFTRIQSQNYSSDLKKYISSKANSLKSKRELYKVLQKGSPVEKLNFNQHIEEVRNKVIHTGYLPKEDEARNAFEITKQTLNHLLISKFEV